MAGRTRKVGFGTILVGAVDWFARYQTGRDLVSYIAASSPATVASRWWISPLIILIGFVILFWEKIFSSGGQEESVSASPVHAEAKVKDSGNSTLHQNFNFGVSPLPSPPQLNSSTKKQVEVPALELHKIECSYIGFSESNNIWSIVIPDLGNKALLVPVYYDPNKTKMRSDLYIKAHLKITDKKSRQVAIVPAAYWLDEHLNYVLLHPGDQKLVLLFIATNKGLFAIKNKKEQVNYFSGFSDDIEEIALTNGEKEVEMILLDDDGFKANFTFDLSPDRLLGGN